MEASLGSNGPGALVWADFLNGRAKTTGTQIPDRPGVTAAKSRQRHINRPRVHRPPARRPSRLRQANLSSIPPTGNIHLGTRTRPILRHTRRRPANRSNTVSRHTFLPLPLAVHRQTNTAGRPARGMGSNNTRPRVRITHNMAVARRVTRHIPPSHHMVVVVVSTMATVKGMAKGMGPNIRDPACGVFLWRRKEGLWARIGNLRTVVRLLYCRERM